jgi:hypothetical protein
MRRATTGSRGDLKAVFQNLMLCAILTAARRPGRNDPSQGRRSPHGQGVTRRSGTAQRQRRGADYPFTSGLADGRPASASKPQRGTGCVRLRTGKTSPSTKCAATLPKSPPKTPTLPPRSGFLCSAASFASRPRFTSCPRTPGADREPPDPSMNGAAATADGGLPHVALIKKRAAACRSGGELSAHRRTTFDP